jgi:outer membrane protein TolC
MAAMPILRPWFGGPLRHSARCGALLTGSFLLTSCANLLPDGGMEAVRDATGSSLAGDVAAQRTPQAADAARSTVEVLLKKPLTADSAVRIALLRHRGLQASYNALGIADAMRVQASLPPNPIFRASDIAGGGGFEFEREIAANILSLATLPARAEIAEDRFRQAQLQAAQETLRVATEARRAFLRAVAARALAGFLAQAQSSAETASELSHRLGETGAANKLDQARNQVFYAEIAAQLASARLNATAERERLVRALGLWGDDLQFRLPGALPPLPRKVTTMNSVEADAVRRRVDLQIARIEVVALAKSYGLTSATRFINLLEVSGRSRRMQEPGGEPVTQNGGGLEFQVPLFDFGEVRARQAEETYMQAVNRLAAKAVAVRSEAREAYQTWRAAYDIARHYQREVLPLRKIISDETLLRYNAMQIDVFALLTEARQRIASTSAAIAAERDFWLADANLRAAVSGGGMARSENSSAPAAAEASAGHN